MPNLDLKVLQRMKLEEIVANREAGSVRLPTDTELLALDAPLPSTLLIKEHLESWTPLRISLASIPPVILIFGTKARNGHLYVTSPVTGLHGRLAFTQSGSLYCLDGSCVLEPSIPGVCSALNALGIGTRLGVPPFFV